VDAVDAEDMQQAMPVEKEVISESKIRISPFTESLSKEGKEEVSVPEHPVIAMTRKQLYDEIWEISVAGVTKKYNLAYAHLMKQIKGAGIPIPPSGYWTKLNFNKPVTKPELPEPADEMISIYRIVSVARKKKNQIPSENESRKADTESVIAELSQTLESSVLAAEDQATSVSLPENDEASGAA
jgi:hypothetical protein